MKNILFRVLLIFIFLIKPFFLYSGGSGSSKNGDIVYLRDQFSTSSQLISGLSIVDSKKPNLVLGKCDPSSGFKLCKSGANSATCCIGEKIGSKTYNAVAYTIFGGMSNGVYTALACFAIPDFTSGVVHKCYTVKAGDTINENITTGVSLNLTAKLEMFDEVNPGYSSDFDKKKTNTLPLGIGTLGSCPSSPDNEINVNSAGYTFVQNAYNTLNKIYKNSMPLDPSEAPDCDTLAEQAAIGCLDDSECLCDTSCKNNGFIPVDLKKYNSSKQSCYICNQLSRQIKFNCYNAAACMSARLLDMIKKNINYIFNEYGGGPYICVYNKDTRLGCSKVRFKSTIRHSPKIARVDDMVNPSTNCMATQNLDNLFENQLVLFPGCHLFQDFPTIRPFRNQAQNFNDPCLPGGKLEDEKGYKHRGTFFNPSAFLIWSASEIKMNFFSDYFINQYKNGNTSSVSTAYKLSKPISDNSSLLATNFGDTVYRIKKTFKDPSRNCSIRILSNSYQDVLVRIEYNMLTNENDFVGYALVPVSNSGDNVIDPLTKKIIRYYTTLSTSNFISSTIYYKDETGNYIKNSNGTPATFSPASSQTYALVRIGSVPRPSLRHYYNSQGTLSHPLSISINQTASSGGNAYVDNYTITLNPANSVSPSVNKNDNDYFIPAQYGNIQIVSDLQYYNPANQSSSLQLNSEGISNNCAFLFGRVFCANLDPCIFYLNYTTNGSTTSTFSYLSSQIATTLQTYCSGKIFCPSTVNGSEMTVSSCETDPINGGLLLADSGNNKVLGNYNFNKDFRNFISLASGQFSSNPLVCINIENPNWLSSTGNVYLYGPYGNISADTVLAFIRKTGTSTISTRPLTNYNPDINQTYTKGNLYKINENIMSQNLPTKKTNIYTEIARDFSNNDQFKWLSSFIGCTTGDVTCINKVFTLRPIEVEEMSMKTLCAPLTSYPTQTNVFSFSRHTKQNDYDLYIPLRCQFLQVEGYSAGGAGMTAQDGNMCATNGFFSQPGIQTTLTLSNSTEPFMSEEPSTGCNGAYLNATININNSYVQKLNNTGYSLDYLSLQIGEETHQCKFNNTCYGTMNNLDVCCVPGAIGPKKTSIIGGCHDYGPWTPSGVTFWDSSYSKSEPYRYTNYNFLNTPILIQSKSGTDNSVSYGLSEDEYSNITKHYNDNLKTATFHGDTTVSLKDYNNTKNQNITLFSLSKGRSNMDYIMGSSLTLQKKTPNYGRISFKWVYRNGGCFAVLFLFAGGVNALTLIYETCFIYGVTDIYRVYGCGGSINYDANFVLPNGNFISGNDDSMLFSTGQRRIFTFAEQSSFDTRVYAANGTPAGNDIGYQVAMGESSPDNTMTSLTDTTPTTCKDLASIIGSSEAKNSQNYNIDNCFYGSSGAFNDGTKPKSTTEPCYSSANNSDTISINTVTNYPPKDIPLTIKTEKTGSTIYTASLGAQSMPYCYNGITSMQCLILDKNGSRICNNPCTNNLPNIPYFSINITENTLSTNSQLNSTTTISVPICGGEAVNLTNDTNSLFYGSSVSATSCNNICPTCNNSTYCSTQAGVASITQNQLKCTYQVNASDSNSISDFNTNISPTLKNGTPYDNTRCITNCVTGGTIDLTSIPLEVQATPNCSNDSDLENHPKYSGAGGSGKLTVSPPTIVFDTIQNGKVIPHFNFDSNQGYVKVPTKNTSNLLPDQVVRLDSDCRFRCPKINLYYNNVQVMFPNFSISTVDLICEYAGDPTTDMEVSPSRAVFPKKCFIVSNNSVDPYAKQFHGAIISSSLCPVASCTNGMYNADESRLYGMCLYPENSSSSDGKTVYQRAIRGTSNIFSGDSVDSIIVYSDLYELLKNQAPNPSVEIAYCKISSLDNGFLMSGDLFAEVLYSPWMSLSCDTDGFWVNLALKNIINPDIKSDGSSVRGAPRLRISYLYPYLDQDGNFKEEADTVPTYQKYHNQAFTTKYNYIEAESLFKEYRVAYGDGSGAGRRVFANFYDTNNNVINFGDYSQVNTISASYYRNLLNSLYPPNSNTTSQYKSNSMVYCPPLISDRIPFDSTYTGNAIWNQAVEGSKNVQGKCCNSQELQIPTRNCLHNGKWGPVKNPCNTECKINTSQP